MKRVVITGPTGAIGISIINRMIEKGIEVLAICNPTSLRINRIPQSPLVKIIKCDLNDFSKLETNDESSWDVFYHLAWKGTFGNTRDDVYVQNQNIKNAVDAVELAKRLGCHTFIGAGSQAEYGRVNGMLTPETPVMPESGYGIAKLCAGMMTRLRCEQLGLKHIWMRVLSVYGPYDGMNTMVTSLIKKLILNESPETTMGEQLWDYLYSDDAGRAFYLAGLYGRPNAVYCLGSGQVRPLKEYICDIQSVVNPDVDIRIGSVMYSPKQVMYLGADISSLKEDTGFQPVVDFKEGVLKTAEWIKGEMEL